MIKLTKSQIRHRELKKNSELLPSILERLERLEHHNKLLNAWLVMDKDPHTKLGLVRDIDRFNKIQYIRIEKLDISGEDCVVKPMHIANMSRYPFNQPLSKGIHFIFKDFEQHMQFNAFEDRAVNEIKYN